MQIFIRPLAPQDEARVWHIFHEVLATSDTHALAADTGKEEGLDFWFTPKVKSFVACTEEGLVIGVYRILANLPGLGDHVANGGYIVDPLYRGHGVAQKMAEHSFDEAKKMGFIAMQYNFVVSTNAGAVHLWQSAL